MPEQRRIPKASAFIQIPSDPTRKFFPPRGSVAVEQQKSKELFYMFIRNNDLYSYLEGVVTEEVPVASMAAYSSTNIWVFKSSSCAALKRSSPSSFRSSFHSTNSLDSPCICLLQLCHQFSSQLLLSISQASLCTFSEEIRISIAIG